MGPHFEKSITLTNGCSVSTPVKALYSYTWAKDRISLIVTVGLRRVGERAFARRSDIRQANIRFFGSYPRGCGSLSVKRVATTVIGIIARRGETVILQTETTGKGVGPQTAEHANERSE